ncbi:hypothetical protein EVAR_62152_1 [Eumeta japonica]|uniref:Uncharacterized protein n=1 Tax=Eumeta variegata TaxID=151549 RepID=A0A4C1ZX07_EUMVA|nr:hypothetical protein EVAR_62152_1 [Eumeta japonica]
MIMHLMHDHAFDKVAKLRSAKRSAKLTPPIDYANKCSPYLLPEDRNSAVAARCFALTHQKRNMCDIAILLATSGRVFARSNPIIAAITALFRVPRRIETTIDNRRINQEMHVNFG